MFTVAGKIVILNMNTSRDQCNGVVHDEDKNERKNDEIHTKIYIHVAIICTYNEMIGLVPAPTLAGLYLTRRKE